MRIRMHRYGRNITTQPVSQVLSSQVTNTSGTFDSSIDNIVHLTFQYDLSQYTGVSQLSYTYATTHVPYMNGLLHSFISYSLDQHFYTKMRLLELLLK